MPIGDESIERRYVPVRERAAGSTELPRPHVQNPSPHSAQQAHQTADGQTISSGTDSGKADISRSVARPFGLLRADSRTPD